MQLCIEHFKIFPMRAALPEDSSQNAPRMDEQAPSIVSRARCDDDCLSRQQIGPLLTISSYQEFELSVKLVGTTTRMKYSLKS